MTDTNAAPAQESFTAGLDFTGGTLGDTDTTPANLTITTAFDWTGGSLSAPGSLSPEPTLTVDSGATSTVDQNPSGPDVTDWLLQLNTDTTLDGAILLENAAAVTETATLTMDAGSDVDDWSASGPLTLTTKGALVLAGSATVTAPLVNDGTVKLGTFEPSVSSYTAGSGSDIAVTVGGTTAGTNLGQLQVGGGVTFAGSLTVTTAASYTPSGSYVVATYSGGESGSLTLVGTGYTGPTISGGDVSVTAT